MRLLARCMLALLLLNLAACSTMQPVNLENTLQTSNARGVDYGSLVEVRMLDGSRASFRVTEIGPAAWAARPPPTEKTSPVTGTLS